MVRRTKSQPFQLIIRRTWAGKIGLHAFASRKPGGAREVKACARSCRRPDWARFVAVVRVPHLAPVQCDCDCEWATQPMQELRPVQRPPRLRSSGAQSKSALLARVANGKAESTSTQTMTSPKPERIHPLQTPRHRLAIPSGTQPIQHSARGRLCCVSCRAGVAVAAAGTRQAGYKPRARAPLGTEEDGNGSREGGRQPTKCCCS